MADEVPPQADGEDEQNSEDTTQRILEELRRYRERLAEIPVAGASTSGT
jgi:hypothetical protein